MKSASGENGENCGINQAQNDRLVGVAELVSAQNGLHLAKEQLHFLIAHHTERRPGENK
ncbi:MAG: hypothetical protein GY764_08820 [Halieaceae bacterium]|nr:hypothetical protein [Halieaceae bacterium]